MNVALVVLGGSAPVLLPLRHGPWLVCSHSFQAGRVLRLWPFVSAGCGKNREFHGADDQKYLEISKGRPYGI